MKSSKHGETILVSVENITPFGIWLFMKDKEYFLSYKNYPYFGTKLLGLFRMWNYYMGFICTRPALDIDLEIDNLENPEKYPLISKVSLQSTRKKAVTV
jgi:hypothetical protein